jgi:hypothetical protein
MKSDKIVAFGKLTSADKNVLWCDGQPLGDYSILVETVVEKNLPFPRLFEKTTKLS